MAFDYGKFVQGGIGKQLATALGLPRPTRWRGCEFSQRTSWMSVTIIFPPSWTTMNCTLSPGLRLVS